MCSSHFTTPNQVIACFAIRPWQKDVFFHHMCVCILQASMTKKRYCWGRGVIVQWVGECTAETGGGRCIGGMGCCPIINPLSVSPTVQMVPAAHMAPNPVIGIRLLPSLCSCVPSPSLPPILAIGSLPFQQCRIDMENMTFAQLKDLRAVGTRTLNVRTVAKPDECTEQTRQLGQ